MGWDWLQDGVVGGLRGALGFDGQYNLRYNPKTQSVENVNPDGTATTVPEEKLSSPWRSRLADERRKAERAEVRGAFIEQGQLAHGRNMQAIREQIAPTLANIQATAAATRESTQSTERIATRQADIAEQAARDRRKFEEEALVQKGREAGIVEARDLRQFVLGEKQLLAQERQNADLLQLRKDQMALDKQQVEYARQQAWRNGLTENIKMLVSGITGIF